MADLYLTNSLTRKKEKFVPLKPPNVGIYSCGPTVYWNQHIGHMYAYVQWDTLIKFLEFTDHKVKWVMNITDVGHMTSDQDEGEDKMEKGAKREGLSVWKVADKYIEQFLTSMELLNIRKPDVLSRATEHIQEQIDLIKKIEARGFTYKTKTGLVFDTSKFEGYADFARLDMEKQQQGARVEVDPEKKKPWDFLLWVTNQPKHTMQWDSPWGRGFPGWHIECTAMSTKHLGEKFDIHTGGREHIPIHHTNEIAQAYGAFRHKTANYWLHNDWLVFKGEKTRTSKIPRNIFSIDLDIVDSYKDEVAQAYSASTDKTANYWLRKEEKISKSGNVFLITDLVDKGYDPMDFRYLVLTSHYRKGLVFSWDSLKAAQKAVSRLRSQISDLKSQKTRTTLSSEKLNKVEKFRKDFIEALSDDLNAPKALAILWEMLKSNIPSEDKYDLALSFDEVLGLGLAKISEVKHQIPDKIQKLVEEREKLRKEGKFKEADKIRKKIQDLGFIIRDTEQGFEIKPAQNAQT